jgi:hypothetical protein
MAMAFAVLLLPPAEAQLRNCSNIYLPECSKSPFAPSGQTYGGPYGPYAYGPAPYGYYAYGPAPYGYYAYRPVPDAYYTYGHYGRGYRYYPGLFGYYRRGPYAWRGY